MRVRMRKNARAAAFAGRPSVAAPTVLTSHFRKASIPPGGTGELVFEPYFVQKGRGPHLLEWAYSSDENWDAFNSNVVATRDGLTISDTGGKRQFGIDVRWNVEGFGYIFITADNGGEFYQLPKRDKTVRLNLNFELAKTRVNRNRRRLAQHVKASWRPSREVRAYLELAESLLDDARKVQTDGQKCGEYAQKALYYAMWGGEMLELEKAEFDIQKRGHRQGFFIGCDARAFYEIPKPLFMERFTELFNFATVTHVVNGDPQMGIFEPQEGRLNFDFREALVRKLRQRGMTVEGRPLFWFHKWVTPDWLKKKSYDELKKYVERHTRAVAGHYGEDMYAWEIVNEFHDWANEVQLNPEQIVELTRFACEVAKDTAPGVHRLINNCCPYAEYVALGEWSGQKAKYRQRTPWQFTKELVDADVDFTLLGQQMYFPYRDLQDIVILIERFESLGKRMQLSEVGVSSGPSEQSVKLDRVEIPEQPYVWHRHWDEELQADWLEGVFTLAYSKPYIEGANWFDLVDPYSYIENGGLLRSPRGEKKAAYFRLQKLQERWRRLKT